jgi:hypothetical protein
MYSININFVLTHIHVLLMAPVKSLNNNVVTNKQICGTVVVYFIKKIHPGHTTGQTMLL